MIRPYYDAPDILEGSTPMRGAIRAASRCSVMSRQKRASDRTIRCGRFAG
jgi:hypothetical protein